MFGWVKRFCCRGGDARFCCRGGDGPGGGDSEETHGRSRSGGDGPATAEDAATAEEAHGDSGGDGPATAEDAATAEEAHGPGDAEWALAKTNEQWQQRVAWPPLYLGPAPGIPSPFPRCEKPCSCCYYTMAQPLDDSRKRWSTGWKFFNDTCEWHHGFQEDEQGHWTGGPPHAMAQHLATHNGLSSGRLTHEQLAPQCECCYYRMMPVQPGGPMGALKHIVAAPGWRCGDWSTRYGSYCWQWCDVDAPHKWGFKWVVPRSHLKGTRGDTVCPGTHDVPYREWLEAFQKAGCTWEWEKAAPGTGTWTQYEDWGHRDHGAASGSAAWQEPLGHRATAWKEKARTWIEDRDHDGGADQQKTQTAEAHLATPSMYGGRSGSSGHGASEESALARPAGGEHHGPGSAPGQAPELASTTEQQKTMEAVEDAKMTSMAEFVAIAAGLG